jgi:hypothetical protein
MNTVLAKNYRSIENKSSDLMSMSLQLMATNLTRQWNRCSLTSNFFSLFHFKDTQTANDLSTIVNEFLENIIRYSSSDKNMISLKLKKKESTVFVEFNCILSIESAQRFEAVLLSSEPRTLAQSIKSARSDTKFKTDDLLFINTLCLIHIYNISMGCRMVDKNKEKEVSILLSVDLKEVN